MFEELLAELARHHVIRVAGVYIVAAWAAFQVAKTMLETLDFPKWGSKTYDRRLDDAFAIADRAEGPDVVISGARALHCNTRHFSARRASRPRIQKSLSPIQSRSRFCPLFEDRYCKSFSKLT